MVPRCFQISAELFWGFRIFVQVSESTSHEDIVKDIKRSLVEFFTGANLLILAEKASRLSLHLHNDVQDIISDQAYDTTFYACSHIHDSLKISATSNSSACFF